MAEQNHPELTPEEKKRRRSRRRRKAFFGFLLRTLFLALVVYVLFFHIVGLILMPSGDMYPRIDAGDLILYYRLEHAPKAQDIVVIEKRVNTDFSAAEEQEEPGWLDKALIWLKFKKPDEKTSTFVCRVVAAAGDTVEITENERLVVNGNSMIESNIFYSTYEYVGFTEYPITLKEGEYFVLADYRAGGADSRFFGPVTQEEIQGTVITILRRNNL